MHCLLNGVNITHIKEGIVTFLAFTGVLGINNLHPDTDMRNASFHHNVPFYSGSC